MITPAARSKLIVTGPYHDPRRTKSHERQIVALRCGATVALVPFEDEAAAVAFATRARRLGRRVLKSLPPAV